MNDLVKHPLIHSLLHYYPPGMKEKEDDGPDARIRASADENDDIFFFYVWYKINMLSVPKYLKHVVNAFQHNILRIHC